MATRIRKTVEEIEARLVGGEPNYVGKTVSNNEMSEALNWYSNNRDSKVAAKYIGDYLKKNKLKASTDTINKQPATFGWLCRLKLTGALFISKHDETFDKMLNDLLAADVKPEEVKPVVKTNVISIQERTDEKVSELSGELEGAIDDYIRNGFDKPISPYALLHGKAKSVHASKIAAFFKHIRQEYDEVLTTKDSDLKEGYGNFTKTQLKKLVAYCDLIILDCNKISGESKSSRKPRKRKAKSVEQIVAKVNYCSVDEEYGFKSLNPRDVVGSLQLWVFNVKTRKLGVYHAEDASGLSIKGSTLLSFSEAKSVQKTVRKPKEIVPEVLSGGKVFLRNAIGNIRAVETKLNGRLNKDTVLLRIVK